MFMKLLTIVPAIEVKMNKYPIVEKFVSINGEGSRAGQLAVFIRFHGCNLNCSYCDTKYANSNDANYQLISEEELISYLNNQGIKNITLTGGEPLLQKNIDTLIQKLLALDYSVEIETNGSVAIKPFISLHRPIFTLDYKLPASQMEAFMLLDNYQYLTSNDVVKFVISDEFDLVKAKEIIFKHHLLDKAKIYFSPVFNQIDPKTIVAFMIDHQLNGINLQLQLHKYIWDVNQRGV